MPVTTIIDGLKTFLLTYSGLTANAPLSVDQLIAKDTEYSIVPLPGTRIIENNIDGSTIREYPFAFEFSESTAADAKRISSNEWAEAFADWLESQSDAGTLPTLATKKTATKIEAVAWGYLAEQSESKVAVYQIQCKLTYEQTP